MKKILLVESAIISFERNKSLLNRDDITVFTAIDCREALEIHRRERVDLIIADMDASAMGGDLLCSLVRGDSALRHVSVILICHDTPADLERVAQCGANAWLTRPVRPEALVATIGQLLAVSCRRGYRILLKVRVQGEMESEAFFCTSHNISQSGMLIETDKQITTGDSITCTFFLPRGHRIVAGGETVRAVAFPGDTFHYGIRFTDLSQESRMEIEKFVSSFTREGGTG